MPNHDELDSSGMRRLITGEHIPKTFVEVERPCDGPGDQVENDAKEAAQS